MQSKKKKKNKLPKHAARIKPQQHQSQKAFSIVVLLLFYIVEK